VQKTLFFLEKHRQIPQNCKSVNFARWSKILEKLSQRVDFDAQMQGVGVFWVALSTEIVPRAPNFQKWVQKSQIVVFSFLGIF